MALADIPINQQEPAVDCAQPDGSVWRRSGSCNRCGECCKSGDPFQDDQESPPKPCRLLQGPDEAGLHACGDRSNPYYLNSCAVWPSAPGHIADFPSCSYRFERVE